jgi:hypothetical protein
MVSIGTTKPGEPDRHGSQPTMCSVMEIACVRWIGWHGAIDAQCGVLAMRLTRHPHVFDWSARRRLAKRDIVQKHRAQVLPGQLE